ncbi:MAG: response regulator transcription factor [Myxococcales bacterium]|nr:response regulator transcription factor [Myxococcales bacterium]
MSEPLLQCLLVEDDGRLADLTAAYLERHGLAVTVVRDGDAGLDVARRHRFDVVLLDVMLPGRSGIEICQALRRETDVPILMLSARGEEADRVIGLELGADDYLQKPFSPRELLARIRATVRRARGQTGPAARPLALGDLSLDPGGRVARLSGTPVDLTSYEFALLYALAERAGRVLEREQLMDLAGGNAEEAFDRSVDVHISRLRAKLGDDSRQPRFIRTVRGVGYLFMTQP